MAGKRSSISGHIEVRRKSKGEISGYRAVISLGKNKESGKKERAYGPVESKEDAEKRLVQMQADLSREELIVPRNKTVERFMMEEWFEGWVVDQNGDSTIKDYKETMERYIFPAFGDIKLQDLSTIYIQRTYNRWKTKSPLSNNGLSVETIRHINRIFKTGLNKAVELEYIKKNPLNGISIKSEKGSNHEVEVYSEEEFRQLIQAVKSTDMELPVSLLFDCMLRRGELLGLKWDSVNLETGMLIIQRTYIESLNGPILKDGTKSNSSSRKIKCTEHTLKLLKRERLRQLQNKIQMGDQYIDEGFVISQPNGLPYMPKSMTRKWIRTLKENNVRHIKLHACRNCSISFALAAGMAPHTVMKRAGHASCAMTLEIYAKVSTDQQDVAAHIMSDSLFKKAVNN